MLFLYRISTHMCFWSPTTSSWLLNLVIWSDICKSIPRAKVNSLRDMSIFFTAVQCLIVEMALLFINVMCKFICDMLHLICAMFSSICNMSWYIYDIFPFSHVACLNPCMMCLKIDVVGFYSFITWTKIALSGSIFVACSWLCRMGKFKRCMLIKLFSGMGRFTFWPMVIVTMSNHHKWL